MTFVIEHLESEVYEWCVLEYTHISEIVGAEEVLFSNVPAQEHPKLKGLGHVESKRADELDFPSACVLDPSAEETLAPADREKFKHFIFGGILGDYPPRKRTGPGLSKVKGERRNLGKEQMSTDTAVLVTKKILDGTPLDKIPMKSKIVIETAENEEVELPYRYVLDKDGKPILPKGMIELLRKEETF